MAYYDFDFPAPLRLFVSCLPNNESVSVPINKKPSDDLANYLLPKLDEICPDYVEHFWGGLLGHVMSITDLPAQYYMPVYHAIMQACDEIDSLTPYKDALNTALRADPRFQEKQAA